MAQSREEKLRKQRESMARLAEQRKKAGTCVKCGQPLHPNSEAHCPLHVLQERLKSRERNGCDPWEPGGMGRPPLDMG